MEALLQVSAWLGILPAVKTKERLPWGRVYWTVEGLGNSIRNRQGWYFPEIDLSRTNRTAVIGVWRLPLLGGCGNDDADGQWLLSCLVEAGVETFSGTAPTGGHHAGRDEAGWRAGL